MTDRYLIGVNKGWATEEISYVPARAGTPILIECPIPFLHAATYLSPAEALEQPWVEFFHLAEAEWFLPLLRRMADGEDVGLAAIERAREAARGSVAWEALAGAEWYELLSLHPQHSETGFYNHEVLGRTAVTDAATRQKLNGALQSGVREGDGTIMTCFKPRHGIRVARAGVSTGFVICFECRQVQVWRRGEKIAFFRTSASPETAFDEALRQANVPLTPKEP
jgi:hypothetical protein